MLTLGAGMMKKKIKYFFSSSFRSLERAGLPAQSKVTEKALKYINDKRSNMINTSKYYILM